MLGASEFVARRPACHRFSNSRPKKKKSGVLKLWSKKSWVEKTFLVPFFRQKFGFKICNIFDK
jgi:hypothetical protein